MPAMLLGIVVLLAVTLAVKLFVSTNERNAFYEAQPCPGRQEQFFSWLRATFRSFTDTHARVAEGYAKYSKFGLPFVVANARYGPICVIPPSQLKEVLGRPEAQVEAHGPGLESISAKYTLQDPAVYPSTSNHEVPIIKKINSNFGLLARELAEETALAFDEHWGLSEEWRSIKVWPSLEYIAARAFNRVFLGTPMCRNEKFLSLSINYSREVLKGAVGSLVPEILRPVLLPLLAWKATRYCAAGMNILQPLVKERIEAFGLGLGAEYPPNDILQWLVEESSKAPNVHHMKSQTIARRIHVLNFNTVPPAALTLAGALLNLYSAPKDECDQFVKALRTESLEILAATPEGYWTRQAVSKLNLMDSTIRESMRISDFGALALPRRVNDVKGIKIGDIRVPKGVHMEVPVHSIHMDEENYQNATKFDPFRFAPGKGTHKSVVTIDETFFSFGYGKNGCPGRWFGTHLMKTMLAHILLHYDVEHIAERPKDFEFMEFRVLSNDAAIKIRRRKA